MARVIVIGAGIGGLTTAAVLARAGLDVIVLEAQVYPGGSITTYHPRREYELRVESTSETVVKYYFTTAGRTAMRVNGVLTWLMVDQVGSTSVISDINGALGDTVKYSAYGEIRAGGTATDYLYTSQRNEAEIALDYYVARFYDPVTAHFIQPDTIVPEAGSSKAYDRYGYVNNNPVRYNDPSGHCPLCVSAAVGAGIGAVAGGIGYGVYLFASGNEFNWGHLALASGGGAAAGALIGTGIGWAAGVSQAAATSAAITGAGAIEGANVACGGDMCSGEIKDVTQTVQTSAPAISNTVSQAANSINTGINTVYQYIENGVTRYYGITNDFNRRASQHLASRNWVIQEMPGLSNLSRFDARAVEQVLIQNAGLSNLYNKINSIAASNNIFTVAVQRGKEILKAVSLLPK